MMELQFQKERISWLRRAVREVKNLEQTQELKLSDGMPDIGRVIAAWGQPILRGKEWRSDSFGISAGMLVWVLYAPEDGSPERCIDGWIPCQMQWDLPSGTPEGQIQISLLPRFVDARSVSPRKILVRAGLAALGTGLVEETGSIYTPGEMPEDVQLLTNTYPVRLNQEAGEKPFTMEEELVLPASCPAARKMVYCTVHPEVSESRILGNRLVFRGECKAHVLYSSEDGQLVSWDFPVSISQFTDLKGSYSADAQAELSIMPTDLEITVDDDGHFQLKTAMTAQYTLSDRKMIPVVEDAYSPGRALEVDMQRLSLPAILETKEQRMEARQKLNQEADAVADVAFLGDFPRQRRAGEGVELEQPGTFQVLYYTPDGVLQASTVRWEGETKLDAHEDAQILAVPQSFSQPQAEITGEGMQLQTSMNLSLQTAARQELNAVTGLKLGEKLELEPGRPSLILCRAGSRSLWQMARENGSTMAAIREASNLEGEPAPDQMLLIPVL